MQALAGLDVCGLLRAREFQRLDLEDLRVFCKFWSYRVGV